MSRAAALLGLLIALFLLTAPLAGAESDNGSLQGAVVNRYGEPLAGAAVRAEHLAEGFVVESIADGKGTYIITNLPPGEYEVDASVGRRADVEAKKVKLAPGSKLTVDFVIDVKEGLKIDPNYRPTSPGLLN